MSEQLTVERLRELLTYDPETGVFVWRVSRGQRVRAGDIAGKTHYSGYRHIKIDQRMYTAHRLAWFYVHGKWPDAHIDHINGNRADNSIANLRDVPRAVNNQNERRARVGNRTGLLGVGIEAATGKPIARIRDNGKLRHLGTFDTPQEAHAAYVAEKRSIHAGCTI